MAKSGEAFESFREGLTAGHEAGRTEDLLYAFGFVVGFIWGAVLDARRDRGREKLEKPAVAG